MDEGGRRSPFAGTWYPRDPAELSSTVEAMLAEAPRAELGGRLLALISPHAGLRYSGPVAAAGYRLLMEPAASAGEGFESALLLGPSHHVHFDGLATCSEGAFATPLGLVPVDSELARSFEGATPRALPKLDVHRNEHSLEMQLPFLQRLLPELRILPVIMGDQSRRNIEAAVRATVRAVESSSRPVLLVASSDLSHYEHRERARELDSEVLDCVEKFDPEALAELLADAPHHA
ncbi:MAG: AmmeMemoRadiSam system protein B, partial [Vicinamibacteria bacterium]